MYFFIVQRPDTESITKPKQPTLTDLAARVQPYPPDKQKRADRVLGWMIAKDLQPFSVVEDVGFNLFCETLQPRYKMPSRKVITGIVCKEIYEKACAYVQSQLSSSASVSLTTDAWTSQAMQSYLTVTAHVIDECWNFKAFVLDTTVMHDSHTADNLAEHLALTTVNLEIFA